MKPKFSGPHNRAKLHNHCFVLFRDLIPGSDDCRVGPTVQYLPHVKNTLLRVIPTMTCIHFVTGKSSGILSEYLLEFCLAYLLAFYLAYLLAFYLAYLLQSGLSTSSGTLSGISFGISSDILSGIHSIWQIFWQSMWQTFWHFIWHTYWQSI